MKHWTTRDISSQQGRLPVITGATGGFGYETAGRQPVRGSF
jgi:short-subunit dehydrogenase